MRAIHYAVFVFISVWVFTPLQAQADTLQIQSAWARSTAPLAKMGAIYLHILNSGADDQLIRANVDPGIASALSIHEMKLDERGMMRMSELKQGLPLPKGGSIELAPGGKHLMLEGLKTPLQVGQVFEITLEFKNAGLRRVSVPVRARVTEAASKTP